MSVNVNETVAARISKIVEGAKLDAMRSNVIKSVGDIDEQIHIWLLSELQEIEKHRNPTKLNQTLSAITGKSVRTQAIHAFCQTFMNVRMTETGGKDAERSKLSDGKEFTVFYVVKKARKVFSYYAGKKDGKAVYLPENGTKDFNEFLKLAAAKAWYDFKPEPVARPFDFDAIGTTVTNTLKRAFTAVHEKGSFEGAHADLLADLYAVALKHNLDVKEVTAALGNEMPKDAPAELSNVIKFPAKRDETTANATPAKPGKKAAQA